MPRLRLDQARRVALAAQGFGRPRPARVDVRHLARVIEDVAQFQVDSVNVAVRAHYMPLFARLGPYDTALLDAAAGRAPRRLYEYWGHAASLIDVRLEPALRLRRARFGLDRSPALRRILEAKPELLDRILADLADRGPLTARDIENAEVRRRDDWGWNWSEAKHVLEYLFDTGRVSVAGRNAAFERRYDLAQRVLPPAVFAQPDPDPDEAYLALVRRAARALGVADLVALSEYFYVSRAAVKRSVARLAALGELEAVEVEGIPRPCWLWAGARLPRRLDVRALVSPFDTLVFERQRLEELFGTRYRIEIYTPPARREYGYYVYLYVHGDRIAARVDLKADRGVGVLRVQAAWLEREADEVETAAGLAGELERMAEWLGLDEVRVAPVGTLAAALARRGFAPTMGPNA